MALSKQLWLPWVGRYNRNMLRRQSAVSETTKIIDDTTTTISEAVQKTEERVEEVVAPVRKSVLKRFPILFLLLVTIGVTATISSLEKLLLQIPFLDSHPSVVLVIGLSILILTGTLYKKLG